MASEQPGDAVADVAVIGGGSAGTMAYLRAVLNHNDTVWFLGDAKNRKQSRGTWVFKVDNIPGMHGDAKPIAGAASTTRKWVEAHPHLKEKSTAVRAKVTGIERMEDGVFRLVAKAKKKEEVFFARHVILATGVMDLQPVIDGSIEPVFPYANRGDLIYCVRCDGHHVLGHRVAVIGPASTAMSIANLMHERYGVHDVAVLTHGAEQGDLGRTGVLGARYGAKVHTSPIAALEGKPKGDGLTGFVLEDGTRIAAEKAIVALGTIVYNDLAKQLGAQLADDGRVVVDQHNETTVPGLFAVGDLVAGKKMQIYTGWDEAVDAADAIDRRVRRHKREALS